jgi:carbon monoxide dehydrogenase subunit G
MKKVLLAILGILVVAVAGVLIYASTLPDDYRIERSAELKAPPEKIFAILNDFQKSREWSPYETKDPGMKRAFSGAASGKGSIYEFDGDSNVGSGKLEIVESIPPSKVAIRLDMRKPFEGTNNIEYLVQPKGETTRVTWVMYGKSPFFSKVICALFFNMDKMVGADMEAGLASLKAVVEK